ncbi:MAG: hypothetical protein NTZ75_03660 [Euryarchaeota archaeon]|jgi:hypothetical protein|nr:hypothetical protein [Thermoplasmata archaeon]MBE3137567.1 hypothetical protein [Thermoplasmata archaeon]MCJ7698046.1 hypothetical protein [Thermoplasmata archaeon]MCX6663321.1 hypothetical protein [Euryarchaeota archaeon]
MREITKAQLTIGLLAYFATIWEFLFHLTDTNNFLFTVGIIVLQLILLLVLAYIIIALLEWVKVFDLKTNAILTLLILVTFRLLSTAGIA